MDPLHLLARAHARDLAAVARRMGLSPEDAVDAVQDAFVTYLQLGSTAVGEEARALLVTIVRNVARNMRRRHHRARPHADVEDVALASEAPSVDALVELAASRARVMSCVKTLALVKQKVMSLRLLEDLSGDDVARELGISPGNVAVLLHRAKRELYACVRSDLRHAGAGTRGAGEEHTPLVPRVG